MTTDQAKRKLIAWAEDQIGTVEGPNNNNIYADSPDMKRLYGWNVQDQPWCDIFVDAGFIACFGYDIGSAMTYQYAGCNGAACRYSADYYKKAGAWHDTPELGDQIFFYVSGGINHTGIVVYVGVGCVVTVEGNTSDMVARRTYQLGATQIAGFGRPKWSLAANVSEDPEPPATTEEPPADQDDVCILELPYLSRGAKGDAVKAAQILLIGRGFRCGSYGSDGDFGPATYGAVYKFQRAKKLGADGIIGPETWSALTGGEAL